MYGFYRVAAISPSLSLGNVDTNVEILIQWYQECVQEDCCLVVFPELSLTGYTCGDLFAQSVLWEGGLQGLQRLVHATNSYRTIMVVGVPILIRNRLYNCGVVIQDGKILGIVPKVYLPNYREFYEKRWFVSGKGVRDLDVSILGREVPVGDNLIFDGGDGFCFGVEICEDLWAPIPPSVTLAQAGATIICNLSASHEVIGKADYRRNLVIAHSGRCMCGYVYASSGVGESSTDLVFSGHCLIAENGILLQESKRFCREGFKIVTEIDVCRLRYLRMSEGCLREDTLLYPVRSISLSTPLPQIKDCKRPIDPRPFVPQNPQIRDARCEEIFHIQAHGLARRVDQCNAKKLIVGVSGGLDSTLALLVCESAVKILHRPLSDVVGVTMPGLGTSSQTYENAKRLCTQLQIDFREIAIREMALLHFQKIGHPADVYDVTYENVQARERTMVLMNLANQMGGIVVGTGDLSELALGWCTYNGDHMSMYGVNASVPKTLVRYIIQWVRDRRKDLQDVLDNILNTPITPELLPLQQDGTITHQTEKILGCYEVHDFYLYHLLREGSSPERLLFLARLAFKGIYEEEDLKKWLRIFLTRFFYQQYKRNCLPDGPKVGTISLSPRGDWRMPSDCSPKLWLDKLDKLSTDGSI